MRLLWLVLLLTTDASVDPAAPGKPEWVAQPARTVDNGYIVYVSSGEDSRREQATFKSEAAGLMDVANECSFAPKGVRVEDHFQEQVAGKFVVYTKTGLSFNDCEIAQAALDPAQIKRIANPRLEEELQKYDTMLQEERQAEAAANADGNADADADAEADDVEPATDSNTTATAPGSSSAAGTASAPAATDPGGAPSSPPEVTSDEEFFVTRQRVFVLKQQVLWAPPDAYAPNAPQTVQYLQTVQPLSQRVVVYQQRHPQIRTWHQAWTRDYMRRGFHVDRRGVVWRGHHGGHYHGGHHREPPRPGRHPAKAKHRRHH